MDTARNPDKFLTGSGSKMENLVKSREYKIPSPRTSGTIVIMFVLDFCLFVSILDAGWGQSHGRECWLGLGLFPQDE